MVTGRPRHRREHGHRPRDRRAAPRRRLRARLRDRRHDARGAARALRATYGKDRLHWVSGDLADAAVPARLVEETVGALGRIDVLVNNAGIVTAKPVARHHRRRVRPDVRRRRARELPARADRGAADARRRLDREHHVRARAHPAAGPLGLRRGEGRARHAQPLACARARASGRSASTPSLPA